jgi:hypothetical protein
LNTTHCTCSLQLVLLHIHSGKPEVLEIIGDTCTIYTEYRAYSSSERRCRPRPQPCTSHQLHDALAAAAAASDSDTSADEIETVAEIPHEVAVEVDTEVAPEQQPPDRGRGGVLDM